MIADVQRAEIKDIRFLRDFRGNPGLADRELRPSGFRALGIFQHHFVAIDLRLLRVRLKQRHQAIMAGNLLPVDHGRLHELFIDGAAILVFGNIALGTLETVKKHLFDRLSKDVFVELQCSSGVLNDLCRLNAR